MGPFSEDRQRERAEAILRLLHANPQLDDDMKSMWKRKMSELSHNEETYNYRVKGVYANLRRSIYE